LAHIGAKSLGLSARERHGDHDGSAATSLIFGRGMIRELVLPGRRVASVNDHALFCATACFSMPALTDFSYR